MTRRIKPQDQENLKRVDIQKIFFADKLNEIPPNFRRISSQRKNNKECFSKFNEHLICVNTKKIEKKEFGESDDLEKFKISGNINRINFDNFDNYLPLCSIAKQVDLQKKSLKKLRTNRGFDKDIQYENTFGLSLDYYKPYFNNLN